jgi:hypothetical protein
LHGIGQAIDVAGSPSTMAAFARAVAGRPDIAEVIYTPVGAWYPGAGWVTPTGSVAADHYDHVHVGTYDRGGRLPPGKTLVQNLTGRAETILPFPPEMLMRHGRHERRGGWPERIVLEVDRRVLTELVREEVQRTASRNR